MPADYDFITDRLAIGDVASRSTDGFCAVVSLLSSAPFDEQYKAPAAPEGVPVLTQTPLDVRFSRLRALVGFDFGR